MKTVTTDDADPSLNYATSGWTHATNSPGAIDGTLSTASDRELVIWTGGPTDKTVQVIGPKGPGFGTMGILASGDGVFSNRFTVDLSAPTRLDQQVLFEFSAPLPAPLPGASYDNLGKILSRTKAAK